MRYAGRGAVAAAVMSLAVLAVWVGRARSHCDTMDGPVVAEARAALEKGDVTPVLKWVGAGQEEEVRGAFAKARAVRVKAPEAKEVADQWFFETVVRLHQAQEGAPYTGLKPAGAETTPAERAAETALASGSVGELMRGLIENMDRGLWQRFAAVQAKKQRRDESVAAGREYVQAYIEYVHYVEGLEAAVAGQPAAHEQAEAKSDSPGK